MPAARTAAPPASPLRQLLERSWTGDGTVAEEVARRLDAGQSLRHVAATLSTQTGVVVSYEAIRRWYCTPTAA